MHRVIEAHVKGEFRPADGDRGSGNAKSLGCAVVILSDRSLREEIAAGRILIEPMDDRCIQPSSIDVKVGNLFRVFRNHTAAVIDVKEDLEDLTELTGETFAPNRQSYEFAVGFRPNRWQLLKVGYEWLKTTDISGTRDNVFGIQLVTSLQPLSRAWR